MCPLCGSLTHLSVGDVSEWYKEYHPTLAFGELVPAVCYFCFKTLKEGEEVFVRDDALRRKEIAGLRGNIKKIVDEGNGALFYVQFEGGKEQIVLRPEIRGLFDKERQHEIPSDG
jgi:hypothetical protein